MSIQFGTKALENATLVDLIVGERLKALSTREWKHRLKGYGYNVSDTDQGHVVTTLLGGDPICVLPAEASA